MRSGMNPRKMEKMMKQMGIKQNVIAAKRVIVETDEGNIIFENPQVTEINVKGQSTFQVIGRYTKEEPVKELVIPDSDIDLVCQQTGVSKDEALKALTAANGDLAQAILDLQKQ